LVHGAIKQAVQCTYVRTGSLSDRAGADLLTRFLTAQAGLLTRFLTALAGLLTRFLTRRAPDRF